MEAKLKVASKIRADKRTKVAMYVLIYCIVAISIHIALKCVDLRRLKAANAVCVYV